MMTSFLRSVAAGALYLSVSVFMTLVNKHLFASWEFSYTFTILFAQMFATLLILPCLHFTGIVHIPVVATFVSAPFDLAKRREFFSMFRVCAPIAFFYLLNVACALTALRLTSVPVYNVIKRCAPLPTLIFDFFLRRRNPARRREPGDTERWARCHRNCIDGRCIQKSPTSNLSGLNPSPEDHGSAEDRRFPEAGRCGDVEVGRATYDISPCSPAKASKDGVCALIGRDERGERTWCGVSPRVAEAVVMIVFGAVVTGAGDLDLDVLGYGFGAASCFLQATYLVLTARACRPPGSVPAPRERGGDVSREQEASLPVAPVQTPEAAVRTQAGVASAAREASPSPRNTPVEVQPPTPTCVTFLCAMMSLPVCAVWVAVWEADVAGYPSWGDASFVTSFTATAVVGLLLNYALYECSVSTTPLTTVVLGQAKAIVSTAAGFFLFGTVRLTPWGLIGVLLSTSGGAMYAGAKFSARK
eukprot:TRINITY_DN11679_c0_g1_i1.p1 TRINITY_DN11679_c0_g1~~TRINITY_DN11679_c0_g1_i1.p1  ORF type:complete len:473 (-),score=68.68 TRINITY_DN11679_c0_g1_i1:32-1450(-)